MASVSFINVEKRYGAAAETVIHRLSAEIADGEFVVIVGPSGCGKSTLLRMVAGLEEISAGEIAIGGRVVNDVEPAARDIAMVFQNYALYPHMSVRRNIAYGLTIARRPKAEIEDRVRRVAETLELTPLLERRPRALSGGQRQRVAMARAIVREPQVFLFDEPLSNLDARLRAQARVEIRRLHAELGVTSLFVTHDQIEAMTLAERMIVMNGGRIEQIGSPEAVYRQPATRFVAGFIGSPPMNLMRGNAAGRRFEIVGGPSIPLPDEAPCAGPAILGWRAEDVAVGSIAAGSGWPLRVDAVELLGAERLLHGRLGEAESVARIDASLSPPRAGDIVSLHPIAGRLHWFDAVSGRRLER